MDNIFAKIVRKEIEANIIYEDEHILAFNDINPVAPIHILVIPKKHYVNFVDFVYNGSSEEVGNYFKTIKNIVDKLDLKDGSFRMITNNGEYSGQTIMYFHTHILGGKQLRELI
jgi:histidine triad (HIT) family protein